MQVLMNDPGHPPAIAMLASFSGYKPDAWCEELKPCHRAYQCIYHLDAPAAEGIDEVTKVSFQTRASQFDWVV